MADGAFMQEYKSEFEAYMQEYMNKQGQQYQPRLAEAMNYSLFAGGKRLRPVLCLAACHAVGGKRETALAAALALEAIHTYSLIHDDLPGMDNDDYRRGRLTNHKVYGEAMAILAGDGLLTMAFEIISQEYGPTNPAVVIALVGHLAQRAGSGGMCAGQAADILSEDKKISTNELKYIHEHKTGDLITAALLLGALVAGADTAQKEALAAYGYYLGLAFQITDDILDVIGDAAKLGKPVGSDDKNNKATYPALYGLEQSQNMAKEAVAQAISALDAINGDTDDLRWLAKYLLSREN